MPDASLKKSMPCAKPAPRKTAPSKAIAKGVGRGCAWLEFGQRHRSPRTRPAFVDGFCAGLDGQRRTWRCRRGRLDTGRTGPSHQPQRHSLRQAVVGGKVGLPFDVILRLAAVLGRKDPIPVAMKLTCATTPKSGKRWKTLAWTAWRCKPNVSVSWSMFTAHATLLGNAATKNLPLCSAL